MDKQQVLKEYIEHKKLTVHNKNKLEDIERYTRRFLESYKSPIDKTSEADLVNFLNSVSNFSIQHRNNLKIYLKNFVKWYFPDYSSRFRNLDKVCRTEKPPQTHNGEEMLTLEQVEQLINGETELEWKVFWQVFFYGGFRPNECRLLKWKDVSFDKDGVILKPFLNKNKKTFYKSLPENAEHFLKEWRKFNSSEWLFPSPLHPDQPIANKTAYFRLKKLSKKILGKQIYPYILRHSVATIKYNDDGIKDDLVANQMGHSKSMKKTYNNLDENKLIANARKIWAKAGDLPKEKKHELEVKVEELQKRFDASEDREKNLSKMISDLKKEVLLLKKSRN